MIKLIAICLLLSGCEHFCTEYVDCEGRIKALQQENTALKNRVRKLRLYAVDIEQQCSAVRH